MNENDNTNANINEGGEKGMINKNFLIFGVLALLIVSGAVVSMNKKRSKTEVLSEQSEATSIANIEDENGVTDLDDISQTDVSQSNLQAGQISVEGGMFYFKPNEIRVKKGEPVKIVFTNKEGIHDFVIDELNVKTNRIKGGESETVEFTPDKAGSFEFYCSVSDHRAKGMVGTLIVE